MFYSKFDTNLAPISWTIFPPKWLKNVIHADLSNNYAFLQTNGAVNSAPQEEGKIYIDFSAYFFRSK